MQEKVTLREIIRAVRELTFDRFIIPAFALKERGTGFFVRVDKQAGELSVYGDNSDHTAPLNVTVPFDTFKDMEGAMDELIEKEIVAAYSPYFKGDEPLSQLIPIKKELTEDVTLFRKYFFSDEEVLRVIRDYYAKVLEIRDVELTDDIVGLLKRPSEEHLALWVSYWLVDRRRLYEAASRSIGQSFTDGSDYTGSNDSGLATSTTVTIGGVFNITEDPSSGNMYEDFNRVGSDNVLGDRYSFWYKLMLWIRELLETRFGDYSLRKNNVIPGHISLTRDLDFRSYYDSYPFTVSPLSRGILSKVP